MGRHIRSSMTVQRTASARAAGQRRASMALGAPARAGGEPGRCRSLAGVLRFEGLVNAPPWRAGQASLCRLGLGEPVVPPAGPIRAAVRPR